MVGLNLSKPKKEKKPLGLNKKPKESPKPVGKRRVKEGDEPKQRRKVSSQEGTTPKPEHSKKTVPKVRGKKDTKALFPSKKEDEEKEIIVDSEQHHEEQFVNDDSIQEPSERIEVKENKTTNKRPSLTERFRKTTVDSETVNKNDEPTIIPAVERIKPKPTTESDSKPQVAPIPQRVLNANNRQSNQPDINIKDKEKSGGLKRGKKANGKVKPTVILAEPKPVNPLIAKLGSIFGSGKEKISEDVLRRMDVNSIIGESKYAYTEGFTEYTDYPKSSLYVDLDNITTPEQFIKNFAEQENKRTSTESIPSSLDFGLPNKSVEDSLDFGDLELQDEEEISLSELLEEHITLDEDINSGDIITDEISLDDLFNTDKDVEKKSDDNIEHIELDNIEPIELDDIEPVILDDIEPIELDDIEPITLDGELSDIIEDRELEINLDIKDEHDNTSKKKDDIIELLDFGTPKEEEILSSLIVDSLDFNTSLTDNKHYSVTVEDEPIMLEEEIMLDEDDDSILLDEEIENDSNLTESDIEFLLGEEEKDNQDDISIPTDVLHKLKDEIESTEREVASASTMIEEEPRLIFGKITEEVKAVDVSSKGMGLTFNLEDMKPEKRESVVNKTYLESKSDLEEDIQNDDIIKSINSTNKEELIKNSTSIAEALQHLK